MKSIFTLLLSTLFTLAAFADHKDPKLSISTFSTVKMRVEVDGRRYNLDHNSITIRDLRSGYHNVKIFREKKRNNNRWWDFGVGNNRHNIIYSNSVYLKEGYYFDITINRFGKIFVDEHRIDSNDDWYNNDDDDDWYDRNRDRDRDKDYDRDKDRDSDRDNRDPRYDDNYRKVMSNQDFNMAKENLRREWFENTRVTTAKFIMDKNYFTSQQVKELLGLFTFENNKLDLAKYTYGKTVDRNNYFIVNDVFAFNNSKEELARYIRDYR